MNITFYGAARNVTGSKHLIETSSGKKILLDCGFFQNRGKDNDRLNRSFSFDPQQIDLMILSHAHIDHSGNIPNLVKQGFNKTIFTTQATIDLCEVMLADSAYIQSGDIEYINRRRRRDGQKALEPIYEIEDVEKAMKLFAPVAVNKRFQYDDEISFEFTDAGHILGSVSVHVFITENGNTKQITFSGDVGRFNDLILKAPAPFPQADYILCESTYGNRLHDQSTDARKKLLQIVNQTCVEQKGKLIIPAFSLGRTQEIIYTLDRFKTENKLPSIPVFVDSPLAIDATNIMRKHSEFFNADLVNYLHVDEDPFGFSNLKYVRKVEESKKINDLKGPCIIISASGMIEAGRIKHHIKNNINDSRNTILIVGYCTPESIGGHLMRGDKIIKIFGNEYPVKANVEVISSFSAHADYLELIKYLSCQDTAAVKKLFLVHGEYEVQQEFKEKLKEVGFKNVEIPEELQSFKL
ncbi:MAG TPA: MBL fold metallo-hydrolase [Bacteroidia bacterium]|jgi:metallo-beta-lactamase family protein|nr:MBL fold metallo-hydrolase [Bacteroidia bacterium]HMW09253.1 MBL fold metallo-hydrolase [Bacteroidia bacterium]HMY12654.1 MBL fold metallo-hydrolase [Bacteroidia bacterium]HMY62994.1 MBL fold metallo-hydrolase [Bacteroidia bacterium]HNC34318.1 MBL fold metallo-hydrolase [Bacteroidia bacterium]